MSPFFSSLGILSLLWVSLPLSATVLQVQITGVDVARGGYLMVGVYDSQATFLKDEGLVDEAKLAVVANASDHHIIAIFNQLMLNKKYAIAVYHEVNGNGKLDKNFLGIPTEGYGFSNNARGTFGPPNFNDTAVSLDTETKLITIDLSY